MIANPLRRTIVLGALGACGTSLIGLVPGVCHAGDRPKALDDGARAVGRAYLQLRPHEADPERLRHLLGQDVTREGRARHILVTRLRQDFEDGRTVTVRGWVLAETEARLCALVALA